MKVNVFPLKFIWYSFFLFESLLSYSQVSYPWAQFEVEMQISELIYVLADFNAKYFASLANGKN